MINTELEAVLLINTNLRDTVAKMREQIRGLKARVKDLSSDNAQPGPDIKPWMEVYEKGWKDLRQEAAEKRAADILNRAFQDGPGWEQNKTVPTREESINAALQAAAAVNSVQRAILRHDTKYSAALRYSNTVNTPADVIGRYNNPLLDMANGNYPRAPKCSTDGCVHYVLNGSNKCALHQPLVAEQQKQPDAAPRKNTDTSATKGTWRCPYHPAFPHFQLTDGGNMACAKCGCSGSLGYTQESV